MMRLQSSRCLYGMQIWDSPADRGGWIWLIGSVLTPRQCGSHPIGLVVNWLTVQTLPNVFKRLPQSAHNKIDR
jgi:hypothetical protein